MIVYRFKDQYGDECGISMPDDGPSIMKCNTDYGSAYRFVKMLLETTINKLSKTDFLNKRMLDVGMGNGNVLRVVREELGADVFGFDLYDYLEHKNYFKDRTFPNTDVRNMPKELLGTFDIAYQRLYSVPFKDSSEVLFAIAKALKPNGLYFVTFDDDEYEHADSFIVKILNELYDNVIVKKDEDNAIYGCLASEPRLNPVITPVDSYYYTLNNEEYREYMSARTSEKQQLVLRKKDQPKVSENPV